MEMAFLAINGENVIVHDTEVFNVIGLNRNTLGVSIITNEDLKAMLDCLVVHISSGYKQRDAVVDAINRLESIYDKYRFRGEENNEDRT